MKLGLKLYPEDLPYIKKYKNIFDFFELFITPDCDVENLAKYRNIIKVVHAAHSDFGFDPSSPSKSKYNQIIIEKAKRAADIVNAKYIVVHPGLYHNAQSKANMFKFLKDNFDSRLIFENLPSVDYDDNKQRLLGATPGDMKEFISKLHACVMLDFGHAICEANIQNKDPYQMIDVFLKLKPTYFHLSGNDINSKRDKHKHLFEVDIDFGFLKKIPKSAWVTMETDPRSFKKDMRDIRIFNR